MNDRPSFGFKKSIQEIPRVRDYNYIHPKWIAKSIDQNFEIQ